MNCKNCGHPCNCTNIRKRKIYADENGNKIMTPEDMVLYGAVIIDKITENKKWYKYWRQGEVKALEIELESVTKEYNQTMEDRVLGL